MDRKQVSYKQLLYNYIILKEIINHSVRKTISNGDLFTYYNIF